MREGYARELPHVNLNGSLGQQKSPGARAPELETLFSLDKVRQATVACQAELARHILTRRGPVEPRRAFRPRRDPRRENTSTETETCSFPVEPDELCPYPLILFLLFIPALPYSFIFPHRGIEKPRRPRRRMFYHIDFK